MIENRRYGVDWAVRTLLGKPGGGHLHADDVEKTFWVALDWGCSESSPHHAGLSADDYQRWILRYYLRMFALEQPRKH